MGACATKPKVSKDGPAEGAAPAPEVKEEETTVSEVKEVVVVAEEGTTTVHAEGSGGAEETHGEDIKARSLNILLQEDEVKEISGQDESVPPPSEELKKQDEPSAEPEIKAAQPVTATGTAEQTAKDKPVLVEEAKSTTLTTEVAEKPDEEKPKSETQEIVPETKPVVVVETKQVETEEKPATVAVTVTEEKK